jgi:quinol monooxygenase YgiN
MIIVAGNIIVRPKRRDAFLKASMESVAKARTAPGCHDFVVAADPLEENRVNVFERWASDEALETFRGDGPGNDLIADIVRADVKRYRISSVGPA